MSADLPSVALHLLGFVSLFQAAGAVLFVALFARRLPRSLSAVCSLGARAARVGILLLVMRQELEAVRMAGDYSGLLDARMQALAWRGSGGLQVIVQVFALLLIAVGLSHRGHPRTASALTGVLLLAGAAALSGHTSIHLQRALLAPLLGLHVLLAAFWFGALLPLMICSRRELAVDTLAVLKGFSNVAGPLVPCIGVAGLVMALTLMPQFAQWHGPYATMLLAKIAAFVLLLGFAAWNRWRAVPALSGPDPAAAAARLRGSITLEYCLICGVLAVTAVMTTLYSPD